MYNCVASAVVSKSSMQIEKIDYVTIFADLSLEDKIHVVQKAFKRCAFEEKICGHFGSREFLSHGGLAAPRIINLHTRAPV